VFPVRYELDFYIRRRNLVLKGLNLSIEIFVILDVYGLRPLEHRDGGFESHSGCGCMSVVPLFVLSYVSKAL
jgi:hypothetical protein